MNTTMLCGLFRRINYWSSIVPWKLGQTLSLISSNPIKMFQCICRGFIFVNGLKKPSSVPYTGSFFASRFSESLRASVHTKRAIELEILWNVNARSCSLVSLSPIKNFTEIGGFVFTNVVNRMCRMAYSNVHFVQLSFSLFVLFLSISLIHFTQKHFSRKVLSHKWFLLGVVDAFTPQIL